MVAETTPKLVLEQMTVAQGTSTFFRLFPILSRAMREQGAKIDARWLTISGQKCGAAQIDRNLHTLMEHEFKEHFKELGAEMKDPGSPFMRDFERNKRVFGEERGNKNQKLIPMRLCMKDAKSRFYRKSGQIVLKE